jgi:hypothetical protein
MLAWLFSHAASLTGMTTAPSRSRSRPSTHSCLIAHPSLNRRAHARSLDNLLDGGDRRRSASRTLPRATPVAERLVTDDWSYVPAGDDLGISECKRTKPEPPSRVGRHRHQPDPSRNHGASTMMDGSFLSALSINEVVCLRRQKARTRNGPSRPVSCLRPSPIHTTVLPRVETNRVVFVARANCGHSGLPCNRPARASRSARRASR